MSGAQSGALTRWLQWLGLISPSRDAFPPKGMRVVAAPSSPPRVPSGAQAPWRVFQPSPSLDGGVIRATVLRDLLARLDSISGAPDDVPQADMRFLSGLVRILGSEGLELPMFPDVSLKLDKLLRQSEPPKDEVVRLISHDPDLLRRVWTAASSSMYARGVADLDHAVARIGYDQVWRIAMSACLHSPVFRAGRYQSRVERLRTQGEVAGAVAGWMSDDPRGDAFLAGLLHAAGGLFVFRSASLAGGAGPRPDLVQEILHQHQAALGVLMARAWNMGESVAAAVGFAPSPERAPPVHVPLARMVHISVVAMHAAEEARAGRDVGGAADLQRYQGLYCDIGEAFATAARAWRRPGESEPQTPRRSAKSA